MVNAYVPGRADVGPATAQMIARRDALLGPAYRLMYERPLHIVKGEGAWLIDPEGRRYLDAYNNVTSLGHCHPAVTEAICRQVQTLATNTRYLHDTILELAERLLASVPGTGLAHLMLTCTGSEANDLAYRIAKVHTGGTGMIVTDTAYHGITDAVSKFSPSLGVSVDLGAHGQVDLTGQQCVDARCLVTYTYVLDLVQIRAVGLPVTVVAHGHRAHAWLEVLELVRTGAYTRHVRVHIADAVAQDEETPGAEDHGQVGIGRRQAYGHFMRAGGFDLFDLLGQRLDLGAGRRVLVAHDGEHHVGRREGFAVMKGHPPAQLEHPGCGVRGDEFLSQRRPGCEAAIQ